MAISLEKRIHSYHTPHNRDMEDQFLFIHITLLSKNIDIRSRYEMLTMPPLGVLERRLKRNAPKNLTKPSLLSHFMDDEIEFKYSLFEKPFY